MTAKTMADICQTRGEREYLMSSLAHSCIHITVEERRTTKKLAKVALREMSLPKWSYSMKCLQVVQKNVLAIEYSIFGIEPLHTFHLSVSKLLKECKNVLSHIWNLTP